MLFSVQGKLESGRFEMGDNFRRDQEATGAALVLSINNDVYGNSNGWFECFIQQ